MKKFYLQILLLACCAASFANTTHYHVSQTNWRWRNNDGGETSATWKAAQNTAISYQATGVVVRLRIEFFNNSFITSCPLGDICPGTPINIDMIDSLQYSTTPMDTLSWKSIGLNTPGPFVITAAGGYVTQGETTTQQLTDNNTSYPFWPGIIMVSESILKENILYNSHTEQEWSLTGTPQLLPNTTYYFRQKQNIISYSYLQYPSLTTASVLAVTLSRFTVSPGNGNVKAEWSAEAGTTFTLQRSTNGQTWQTIQKINTGTSSSASYTVYDNSPPGGITLYYRLQSTDKDGKVTYSAVRSVIMPANRNLAFVVPNPATTTAVLHFTGITGTKYGATIADVSGKTVLNKNGIAAQGNNQVILDVKTLAKGMYFVRFVNGDSVENLKLVKE